MSVRRTPNASLFVDFDGTIVDTDTAQIALDRFGDPDWNEIDKLLERGEISFEESLRREFATLRASEKSIIEEVARRTEIRPNFASLVDFCKRSDLPLKVVSGGLDFCIRHFLNHDNWLGFIEVYAPKSHFNGTGYSLTFPRAHSSSSTNFKDGLIIDERRRGRLVWFVGNGFGDLPAAKESDLAFAITGSRLAELCREQKVPHEEIDDFDKVIDSAKNRLSEIE
jgi:2,3-diketo-5-methylthio-1-phosphopentane phosphatase